MSPFSNAFENWHLCRNMKIDEEEGGVEEAYGGGNPDNKWQIKHEQDGGSKEFEEQLSSCNPFPIIKSPVAVRSSHRLLIDTLPDKDEDETIDPSIDPSKKERLLMFSPYSNPTFYINVLSSSNNEFEVSMSKNNSFRINELYEKGKERRRFELRRYREILNEISIPDISPTEIASEAIQSRKKSPHSVKTNSFRFQELYEKGREHQRDVLRRFKENERRSIEGLPRLEGMSLEGKEVISETKEQAFRFNELYKKGTKQQRSELRRHNESKNFKKYRGPSSERKNKIVTEESLAFDRKMLLLLRRNREHAMKRKMEIAKARADRAAAEEMITSPRLPSRSRSTPRVHDDHSDDVSTYSNVSSSSKLSFHKRNKEIAMKRKISTKKKFNEQEQKDVGTGVNDDVSISSVQSHRASTSKFNEDSDNASAASVRSQPRQTKWKFYEDIEDMSISSTCSTRSTMSTRSIRRKNNMTSNELDKNICSIHNLKFRKREVLAIKRSNHQERRSATAELLQSKSGPKLDACNHNMFISPKSTMFMSLKFEDQLRDSEENGGN